MKVINPIGADMAAGHKLLQLQYAARAGLRIPKTIATNSPDNAKLFYEAIGSGTVFKPFTGTAWQFTGTQRMAQDSIRHLECVAYSPVIFQEEIEKMGDVRANVIDGEVFSIIIQSERSDAPLDWRMDQDRHYSPHKLPCDVESALIDVISKLGLRFGACDLALTKRGEYVFFEINPGGQWLFAEIMTGQELSWAFARALLNGPERYRHNNTIPND
jgi:glutathione synthase/RimK-type ligase-like ATP-grasp enzyme